MPTTIFSSHSILYFCLLWTSVHDVSNLDGLAHQLTNKPHQNPELMSILLVEKKSLRNETEKKKKKKKKDRPMKLRLRREKLSSLFFSAEFYRGILLNTLIIQLQSRQRSRCRGGSLPFAPHPYRSLVGDRWRVDRTIVDNERTYFRS